MSSGHNFSVGDVVEYRCKKVKRWIRGAITKVEVGGIFLTVRGTILPSSDIPTRLRAAAPNGGQASVSDGGSVPQSASGSDLQLSDAPVGPDAPEGPGLGRARERGQVDPAWQKFTAQWLAAFDGKVVDIFGKFEAVCREPKERTALKERMLKAIPKLKFNANYTAFESHPSANDVHGHVHPSMLSFSTQAWRMFPIYPTDFAQVVCHITTNGLPDCFLRVSPCEQYEHAPTMSENWSDFAWGPRCSFQELTQMAAIVFITVSAAGSENAGTAGQIGAVAPELPPWLVQDLGAMHALCKHHGGSLPSAIQCMKETAYNGVAHRRLDALIVQSWLRTVSSGKDNLSPKDIIRRYNAQVFYDKRLLLDERMERIQLNLLNPERRVAGQFFSFCGPPALFTPPRPRPRPFYRSPSSEAGPKRDRN